MGIVADLLGRAKAHEAQPKPEPIPPTYFVFQAKKDIHDGVAQLHKEDREKIEQKCDCIVRALPDNRVAFIPKDKTGEPWAREALQLAA